jgi:3-hydroxymyristoyl/3-hydroxydecanoyl-(acyl carrier protein) dehydratase
MEKTAYDEAALDALRAGNPAACFGPLFTGKTISASGRLPGARMRLIDRVLELDPTGGRYGLGRIRAEADIRPDKWFLTCHFVDDRVMPGTLMYECCAHTLRVFLQRLGWLTEKDGARYEPVMGVKSRLKCRGPVTPETRHVVYEIEIKELGYGPEPYAIADALMYGDGHRIVWFQDMGMRLTGVTRSDMEALWAESPTATPKPPAPVFDEGQILAFAQGKPSEAFGAPYRPFDSERFIARLPRPPFSLMSRVVHAEPRPWELKPGGWITAEYDVPKDAWYFGANRTATLPVSILMEIALQPCGWLAAYAGSALKSEKDLRFRNLGGEAELLEDVSPGGGTLSTRARMTNVSAAGEMIIEHFDFEVAFGGSVFYRGSTNFGFFTAPALARQVGIGKVPPLAAADAQSLSQIIELPLLQPLTPSDRVDAEFLRGRPLEMPGKALLMLDRITRFDPAGGPQGLGYLSAEKTVDPEEWFFTAHFYRDPVCPGSLGIESFVQLLRHYALEKWPHLSATHRVALLSPSRHLWTYRGQVTPTNRTVTVEAAITQVEEGERPTVAGTGYLHVDGLTIYKMENFGICLLPERKSELL